jgi:hypothetical protein
MPLNTKLKTDAEHRDAIRRDVDYELQIKPVEVSGYHLTDANKPTPKVTPIVTTKPKGRRILRR